MISFLCSLSKDVGYAYPACLSALRFQASRPQAQLGSRIYVCIICTIHSFSSTAFLCFRSFVIRSFLFFLFVLVLPALPHLASLGEPLII